MTLGYGKQGICVDTHVHRVSNRVGLVETTTPEQTEFALMEVLPEKYWIGYNELVVSFGQKVCKPISPHCSTCFFDERLPEGRRGEAPVGARVLCRHPPASVLA